MTRDELQALAHSHDSSRVRCMATGIVMRLDQLDELLARSLPEDQAKQRRIAQLRAERFPTPARLAQF